MGPKISNLAAATVVARDDVVPLVAGGVNYKASGLLLASAGWKKYTLGYAALRAAGTTQSGTLFSLLGLQNVEKLMINVTQAFTILTDSIVQFSVGVTGFEQRYFSALDITNPLLADPAVFVAGTPLGTPEHRTSATAVKWYASSRDALLPDELPGAVLNGLAAGSVDIWVKLEQLPA